MPSVEHLFSHLWQKADLGETDPADYDEDMVVVTVRETSEVISDPDLPDGWNLKGVNYPNPDGSPALVFVSDAALEGDR